MAVPEGGQIGGGSGYGYYQTRLLGGNIVSDTWSVSNSTCPYSEQGSKVAGGNQSSYGKIGNGLTTDLGNFGTDYENAGFGFGGNTTKTTGSHSGGGGGGGWYGGGPGACGTNDCGTGGGGGSGYIGNSALSSKGMYMHNRGGCSSSTAAATKTTCTSSTGAHVANRANTGNGYARITYLGT